MMNPLSRLLLTVLVSSSVCPLAGGEGELHIEDVHVSNIIRQGDNTTLDCDYNLNGTVLYVLRWYKDDQEFYRYMPREMPANKDFGVAGVRVLMSNSTARSVVLLNATSESSGVYRCEVSVEGPSFETDSREAVLRVIEPPKGKPFITLAKGTLNTDEFLVANCSGPKGRPAPHLVWTIASQQVEEKYTERWPVHSLDDDGDSVVSSLRLPPEWLLRNGVPFGRHTADADSGHRYAELNLTCVSRLYGLYEDLDFVPFRLRKPPPPAPVKMADEPASPGVKISSSPAANVLHDALRNAAGAAALLSWSAATAVATSVAAWRRF